MAEIDYYGIELAIKALLEENIKGSDVGADKLFVDIEENFNLIPDRTPIAYIRLEDYETPQDEATIGGNAPYRTFLNLEVWCYQFGFDDREASKLRDKLLQKVKEVFKNNLDLGENILILTFRGGKFDSGQDQNEGGFFKGVSIELKLEVRE